MNKNISESDVRSFLVAYISNKLEAHGRKIENGLPDDYDFLLSGAIDSLGILKLIMELKEHFGVSIDFEEIDPEKMTIVKYFCNFVADKINSA